jgi:hypothetical protein
VFKVFGGCDKELGRGFMNVTKRTSGWKQSGSAARTGESVTQESSESLNGRCDEPVIGPIDAARPRRSGGASCSGFRLVRDQAAQ